MRIAQIAPLYESVPPATYGGTERVISALCDGLTRLGHDVALFAAATSDTSAHLESVVGAPLRSRMTVNEMVEVAPHFHLRMLAEVFDRAGEFDVIHSHVDIWTLPFTRRTTTPTLLTLHGRLDLDVVQQILPLYPEVALVSISDDQRRPLAGRRLRWLSTVYNGLDLESYALPRPPGDGHLCFVGRISPEKGPALAVDIARRTGHRLRVAAKVDPLDLDYYEQTILPLFTPDLVEFVGEVDEAHKPAFFASAAATLFPSDWPEPFGLVMIESLAAGTPVIALRRGSVPEVLIDGITGFVCDDADEMVQAVDRLGDIDPEACRRHARRFSAERMSAAYDEVYRELAGSGRSGRPARSSRTNARRFRTHA